MEKSRFTTPVLVMYHGTPENTGTNMSPYWLVQKKFEEHLDLLIEFGWKTGCVRDLLSVDEIAANTAILTFDDGFADNYRGAFLPLVKRNMTATWFLVSGKLGASASWIKSNESDSALLSPAQVVEMHRAGMEIGSHTVNHTDLSMAPEAVVTNEVRQSKSQLEDLLGTPITSFAYPYGRYNAGAIAAVNDTGYQFACSVEPGRARPQTERLLLRRVTVFSHDSLSTFARKLLFGDNAVSWPKMARYVFSRMTRGIR